jgi:ATP-dependent Lhr-like helicase
MDVLNQFLPPVREWFRRTLGEPTPAQEQGWPAIVGGQNTLILAPTGSGKTLAAFLACLDGLWRQDPPPPGVSVLYISPLKALSNDIEKNLQAPLGGVAEIARAMGQPLPELRAAVRTGDTPTAERQRLIRQPPNVLITTPESLHLLLTSRGRETLRNVTHCIVDEIHAMCANKRGVFLSLLLERLEALNPRGFVRIGLSATQRPLEEVARYLGGFALAREGRYAPRPVTVVDAGIRRDLDVRVLCPVEQFGPNAERSVWPAIYRVLAEEVRGHRSTIIFANNRRTVERITACVNELVSPPESLAAPTALPRSIVPAAEERGAVVRAHHGSVALEVRHGIEQALKEGRLAAVAATASLELGIDMGAVDLVCQVESPGNVSKALQRVGRAGHLVGARSEGRLIAKTATDLLEMAVLSREMLDAQVEEIRVPVNCLDVLAQQLVAMVAMESWEVPALYALIRRAYPFRDLTAQALEAVLEMICGRYRWHNGDSEAGRLAALQPRISWDRTHNRLHALPGSQQLALVSGGVIPDTGQYPAWTTDGVRIGELDEEFIYERRIGDTFLLGTNSWRLENIDVDRVIVSPAEGMPAMVPFWKGENVGRSHGLGLALGRFLRELQARIDDPDCLRWLEDRYCLDRAGARNVHYVVQRQLLAMACLPTDQTISIEASRDPLGDWQVIVLSPFGQRLHLALRLAVEARLRQRLGYRPQCLHHNDGLLIRLTDTNEPVLDLFDGLTSENVEDLALQELGDSALFALRFRQNAGRALLLPRLSPGKRAPLWLQRLRGRDLLQAARRHADFPIVIETFRECLHDHLDVPRLREVLADISAGRIQLVAKRLNGPSPFAANLLFAFTMAKMYDYDGVDAEPQRSQVLDRQLLEQLVKPEGHEHLLDARAIQQVERRLRGIGRPPRTNTEMAEWLRRLGDLTDAELEGPMPSFLEELELDGTVTMLELPGSGAPSRWILREEEPNYRAAFGLAHSSSTDAQAAGESILQRFLATHALVGLTDMLARYPFDEAWVRHKLDEWTGTGRAVVVPAPATAGDSQPAPRWSAPANLEQVQRSSLALERSEVIPCSPVQFADFVLRWQHVHAETRLGSPTGLRAVLERLEGVSVPADLLERILLPSRVLGYQPRWLEEMVSSGEWVCVGNGDDEERQISVAFWRRESLASLRAPTEDAALPIQTERVLEALQGRGASFVMDLVGTTELDPSIVRTSLRQLVQRGLVTNDRWDALARSQPGEEPPASGFAALSRGSRPNGNRRRLFSRPEGRWSLIGWGHADTAHLAVFQASLLLDRYGIAARELALMDPTLLPWRVLYEVLSRMELAGQVRRGYFVEGLSGAQFAWPEAGRQLQAIHLPSTAGAPVLLVHTLDPANLYGTGAPLDIPMLDGGTRALQRRAGNWLVLRAGRPLLVIEQHGKRLTSLPSASAVDLEAAIRLIPEVIKNAGSTSGRHRLTVETWNGEPVASSAGRQLLELTGFVRDYQFMTLYAAFAVGSSGE